MINFYFLKFIITFIRKQDKDTYLSASSYQPLTISTYFGKILERVLEKRLLLFCREHNIIDEAQEGFLPQKNTTRYLYRMLATLSEAKRRRLQAIVLLIDFEKAFDSVPISCMLSKLHKHGVDGKFLKLISSFLSQGTISLRVNDYIGPRRRLGFIGLPQGSVLSPLLFIIYIADLLTFTSIPDIAASSTSKYKYADDGSIVNIATSLSECHRNMQLVCDSLKDWCYKWRLMINCKNDKTEAIIISSKESSTSALRKLKIGNKEIEYVNSSRVLELVLDNQLTFEKHAKANLKSCWYEWHHLSDKTTRKRGLNTSSLAILFKPAVLTKLMYASPVWLQKNLSVFKKFISRALLKITGAQFFPPKAVSEVLLYLPPLELVLETFVVKFYLKCLSVDDNMRSLVMQLEETPTHPFYKHIMSVKNYMQWKSSETLGEIALRDIVLIDAPPPPPQQS